MNRCSVGMYSLLLLMLHSTMFTYDAYVIVPVADAVGEPLSRSDAYATMPCSGDYAACRRIHQMLYHERVRVIETLKDQVHIELPTVFYRPFGTTTAQSTFWTRKKYLLPIDQIKGDKQKLPHAPSYKTWTAASAPQATITLTQPFHDPTTNLTFSAGTQFISAQTSDKKRLTVYLLDPKTHMITTTTIPLKICFVDDSYTKDQRIKLFIDLIRSWIANAACNTYIPYIWGGTSISTYATGSAHCVQTMRKNKTPINCYDIKAIREPIKTGCDCSGLIFRAAQICGIPYFFKNSYTATCYLKSVCNDRPVAPGDIIWIPGHVMIIADLHKNTLFEARSYEHGYGKLHEIPLEKVFKGIKNYQDLLTSYRKKLPLYRINRAGVVRDTFKEFKILSLASAWDINYACQR